MALLKILLRIIVQLEDKVMKKLEADDTLFATFHSAFEVLTEIETTVFPSMLSLCIPIGCFMNAAMEAAEAAAKSSSGNSGSRNGSAGTNHTGSNVDSSVLSGESLKAMFVECLLKGCHFVIGTEYQESTKAFTEACRRYHEATGVEATFY